ncbi:NIPSNAP-domain-containing protein [Hysterangium stoloniferum]|nr:NIPSNAP-domain-containing protein [Hysterangium stoloniferum]
MITKTAIPALSKGVARASTRQTRNISVKVFWVAQMYSSRTNKTLQSLLHGSPEAKKIGDAEILQHSRKVARGKYIHSFEVHRVKPDAVEQYKKAAEKFYTTVVADSEMKIKLTGNWEVVVGEQDTFGKPIQRTSLHIMEYENFHGYDRALRLFQGSSHEDNHKSLLPHIVKRTTQLNQEFAFFPSSPPRTQGGIFEMRSYQLQPGRLLEWESAWRRGIEARKQLMAPVGAWFSQVGRLNQVHHIWQYPDLHTRKEIREQAWEKEGWSETVSKTSQMATYMDASILTPLSYSPLK